MSALPASPSTFQFQVKNPANEHVNNNAAIGGQRPETILKTKAEENLNKIYMAGKVKD